METLVNSSKFAGKWYHIASTYNLYQKRFIETFLYLSKGCGDYLDLLLVGVKKNRDKKIKTIPLKIFKNGLSTLVVFKKGLLKITLNILTFDEANGLLILSDSKMRNITVFSKKDSVNQCILEEHLNTINFLKSNNKEIKLYSRHII